MRRSHHIDPGRMRVAAALAVSKDIELDLANAAVKLLCEWFVFVVQALPGRKCPDPPKTAFAGRNAGVVAIVRPN